MPSANEPPVIALIAAELRRNDECGTGPLSEQEYMDDARAILRIVRGRYREALEQIADWKADDFPEDGWRMSALARETLDSGDTA